jgi:glucans biosynthesis protein
LGDWGKGAVRLVEIPSDLEVNDNIVTFWVPEAKPVPGTMMEFSYRLRWGALAADPDADIAFVKETRAGVGGVSGVENPDGTRKFVVDFEGGLLASLPPDADVKAVVTIAGGEIVHQALSEIPGTDFWRLVLDISAAAGSTTEMGAHITGYGRKLSETWLYQWVSA